MDHPLHRNRCLMYGSHSPHERSCCGQEALGTDAQGRRSTSVELRGRLLLWIDEKKGRWRKEERREGFWEEAGGLSSFSEGPPTMVSSTGIPRNLAISHGIPRYLAVNGCRVQTARRIAGPHWPSIAAQRMIGPDQDVSSAIRSIRSRISLTGITEDSGMAAVHHSMPFQSPEYSTIVGIARKHTRATVFRGSDRSGAPGSEILRDSPGRKHSRCA